MAAGPITHCIVQVTAAKDERDQDRKVIIGQVFNAKEKFTLPVKDAKKLVDQGDVDLLESLTHEEYIQRQSGKDVSKHNMPGCLCDYHKAAALAVARA